MKKARKPNVEYVRRLPHPVLINLILQEASTACECMSAGAERQFNINQGGLAGVVRGAFLTLTGQYLVLRWYSPEPNDLLRHIRYCGHPAAFRFHPAGDDGRGFASCADPEPEPEPEAEAEPEAKDDSRPSTPSLPVSANGIALARHVRVTQADQHGSVVLGPGGRLTNKRGQVKVKWDETQATWENPKNLTVENDT